MDIKKETVIIKTLIIEFQISGHYPEYLKHVLKKINEKNVAHKFIVAVNPNLKKHLQGFKDTPIAKCLHFFDNQLGEQYAQLQNTKQMADFIYAQIINLKKKYAFHHVLFLNLNLILRHYTIFNPFKRVKFSFSGIILNSPFRFRKEGSSKWITLKREFYLKLLIQNKNCTHIYLLNDKEGAAFYGRWSSKIKPIVDPIRIVPPSSLDVRKYHGIPSTSCIFLQIGKLSKYKGTLEIFKSISELNTKHLQKMHFLFIGKSNKDIEENIQQVKKSAIISYLSIRDEFISEEDFTAYIEQSNVVLMTNKNTENSSGIVNHCIVSNKVVIAPNKGYFKETLQAYQGAVLYDEKCTLTQAIVKAYQMYPILEEQAKQFDKETYINENSADIFAETVLQEFI